MRPAKSPLGPWCDRPSDAPRTELEPDQAQRDWEERWEALTSEERAYEIRLMDEHVSFWEKNKGVFE